MIAGASFVLSDPCTSRGAERLRTTSSDEASYPGEALRDQRSWPPGVPIAAVLRMRDGAHQYDVLRPVAGKHLIHPYSILGSSLRTTDWRSTLPIATLAQLSEPLFLFISGSLECVNHLFLDELVKQALQPDVGLVSGESIDLDGKILHAGWIDGRNGELVDEAAGEMFSAKAGRLPDSIRAANAVAEFFFATRREHLAAVGGLMRFTMLACRLWPTAWRCTPTRTDCASSSRRMPSQPLSATAQSR